MDLLQKILQVIKDPQLPRFYVWYILEGETPLLGPRKYVLICDGDKGILR